MQSVKEVGIAGYGSYGRPIALNLRSAGVEVVVGELDDERAFEAMREGFPNFSPAEVCGRSELVLVDREVSAALTCEILAGERSVQAGTVLFLSNEVPNSLQLPGPLRKDIAWLRPSLCDDILRTAFLGREHSTMEYFELENVSGRLRDTVCALAQALRVTVCSKGSGLP